ncbi:MAG: phytoene desaturase family protein [Myxococcota bacterium]
MAEREAVVVGAGPNGLSAAITLARAGWRVVVYEAAEQVGGGSRTQPLTEPGFLHDVCSTAHPLGAASPVFRKWPLEEHGLEWIHAPIPLAHALDGGESVALHRSVEETAAGLGADGRWWAATIGRYSRHFTGQMEALLSGRLPPAPFSLLRLGAASLRSARGLAMDLFEGRRARALFAGCAAHSALPLHAMGSAAFGLVLAAAGHSVGWPLARGGSVAIAEALASYLRSLGGEIVTGRRIESLREAGQAGRRSVPQAVLLDVTPHNLLRLAGDDLGPLERGRLRRYRYGPAAFKVDWALSGPVPWSSPDCARAGTVHLGGTLEEIALAESAPWQDRVAARPFLLVAQPSVFDRSRAPEGRHVAWTYCHVPHGWSTDEPVEAIEAQVERFAPGFKDRIIARSVMGPRALELYNSNNVGGDVYGGALDLAQLLERSTWRCKPRRIRRPEIFLCSSSTLPGPGVHGMCGYLAARAVLARYR